MSDEHINETQKKFNERIKKKVDGLKDAGVYVRRSLRGTNSQYVSSGMEVLKEELEVAYEQGNDPLKLDAFVKDSKIFKELVHYIKTDSLIGFKRVFDSEEGVKFRKGYWGLDQLLYNLASGYSRDFIMHHVKHYSPDNIKTVFEQDCEVRKNEILKDAEKRYQEARVELHNAEADLYVKKMEADLEMAKRLEKEFTK